MYLSSYDALEEARTPYEFFSGILGDSPLPAKEFLDEVRSYPANFRKLLLMITFHPRPQDSSTKLRVRIKGSDREFVLLDQLLLLDVKEPAIFFGELRRIADEFRKRDAQFRRQVETELQLQNDLIAAAGQQAMKSAPATLQPLLLEALLMDDLGLYYLQLGLKAKAILPQRLVDRLGKSEVPEAHYVNLGIFFRRYGELQQSKDAAFKALVERERERRRQKQEQEKMRQKRRRR